MYDIFFLIDLFLSSPVFEAELIKELLA